jgi:hypothetical protein
MGSSDRKRLVDSSPPALSFELQTKWRDAISGLGGESDRGVALLGAAYLDTALKSLLTASLAGGRVVADRLLTRPSAPLSALSARIAMAYGLGLIGPHYFSTLEAIREIRNTHSHFRRMLTF